jgi:CRP-like cAMP-binding protein
VAGNTLCCWKIPRQNFIETLDSSPELNKELLTQLMDEYLQLSTHYFKRKNGETPVMLCSLLLSRSIPNEDGYFYLPKSYSNVKIAAYLGVHKVTATRIINVLQKKQIITRTPNGLKIIDREQLQRYATNQEKLNYK